MAKPRGSGKGPSYRYTIRLDEETARYYRARASDCGVTMSELLRQLLMHGVITETVVEIETRLKATVAEMNRANALGSGAMPENLLRSVYLTEELLKAIVHARDIQELYRAQDRVTARLADEKMR